jgi:hypothetical protein
MEYTDTLCVQNAEFWYVVYIGNTVFQRAIIILSAIIATNRTIKSCHGQADQTNSQTFCRLHNRVGVLCNREEMRNLVAAVPEVGWHGVCYREEGDDV